MPSCQYCQPKERKCNDIHTKDIKITDSQSGLSHRYEIYYCTRPKGHAGGRVACWDEPDKKDPTKMIHTRKAWIN